MSRKHTGPTCDRCGSLNCRKHYRLDPTNWHERRALLCTPCGKKLGYTPMDYGHGYFPSTGRRAA